MNKKRFIGFILILFGLLLALSKIVLTGAVIGSGKSSFISLIGALSMIVGIVLVLASKKEDKLEERVKTPLTFERTKAFDYSIRSDESKWVEKAVAKIGTGIGREHKLQSIKYEGRPAYAIDASGRGRVLFTRKPGNVVVLQLYDSKHRYKQ